MQQVIEEYFTNIFSSMGCIANEIAELIIPRISPTQNINMLRPFTEEEIKEALFSMMSDKSPGRDGLNPGFYQYFWKDIGADLISHCIDCLNKASFLEGLNDTYIVLIPKKQTLKKTFDMRPIALCNVMYKIMAKAIVNRMKPLLGKVISDSQSAYVPNKLITNNILIASEVGHFLRRKQCGMQGWAALKLDMAKAYDQME